MGVFEDPRFAAGTYVMAKAVAGSCGFSVVGGGDSVAALDELGLAGRVGFVSTGAGRRSSSSNTAIFPASSHYAMPPTPRHGDTDMASGAPRRRPLVSGNWKMHHDHLQSIRTVQDLGLRLTAADVGPLDVSVHPPFTDLRSVQTVLEDRAIPVALAPSTASARTRAPSPARWHRPCWPVWE